MTDEFISLLIKFLPPPPPPEDNETQLGCRLIGFVFEITRWHATPSDCEEKDQNNSHSQPQTILDFAYAFCNWANNNNQQRCRWFSPLIMMRRTICSQFVCWRQFTNEDLSQRFLIVLIIVQSNPSDNRVDCTEVIPKLSLSPHRHQVICVPQYLTIDYLLRLQPLATDWATRVDWRLYSIWNMSPTASAHQPAADGFSFFFPIFFVD